MLNPGCVRIFNQNVKYCFERFSVIHFCYFINSFAFIILILANQYFETVHPKGISFCMNKIEF